MCGHPLKMVPHTAVKEIDLGRNYRWNEANVKAPSRVNRLGGKSEKQWSRRHDLSLRGTGGHFPTASLFERAWCIFLIKHVIFVRSLLHKDPRGEFPGTFGKMSCNTRLKQPMQGCQRNSKGINLGHQKEKRILKRLFMSPQSHKDVTRPVEFVL